MWEKHLAECLVHGRSLINVTLSTCHPFAVRFKSDNCIITCKLQSTYILREKEMATHSSILAWRVPWTKEPGGLQSMGSQRVRHNWVTHIHTHTYILSHIISSSYWWWVGVLQGKSHSMWWARGVNDQNSYVQNDITELHSKMINLLYLKWHRLRNIGWSGHFCVDRGWETAKTKVQY